MKPSPFSIALAYLISGSGLASASGETLKLKIQGNGYSDETIVRFISGATNAFDGSYDAWKLFSPNASAPELFTRSSENYELCINSYPALSADFSIGIWLDIPVSGNYTLTSTEPVAFSSDTRIYLFDSQSGITYDLRSGLPSEISLPAILPNAPPRFTVSFSGSGTLPVQLTEFTAFLKDAGVKIQWETSSEFRNDHFIIERSFNPERAASWIRIARLNGAGNSSVGGQYEYMDYPDEADLIYYRICQVDDDGSESVGNMISVRMARSVPQVLYPNPARSQFHLPVSGLTGGSALVGMFDLDGRMRNAWNIQLFDGQSDLVLEVPAGSPSGACIVRLQKDGIVRAYILELE